MNTTQPTAKKYAQYCRKSTEPSDRQALSLETQQRDNNRLIATEVPFSIVELIEESHSAWHPGRPAFDAMLDRVERGELDGIIAWHPDRLAKNAIDGGRIIYLLDQGKLKDLRFATYRFENSPEGKFMLGMMFVTSKYSSDRLSGQVQGGFETRFLHGWAVSRPGIGYLSDRNSKTIVIDPERFDIVRRMWDLLLQGNFTVSAIHRIATHKWHLRTRIGRKQGLKPLSLAALYKLFRNPFYAGVIRYHGQMKTGAHPPMITLAEFQRAQEIVGRKRTERPIRRSFAYTGFIRCGNCGLAVTAEVKVNRQGRSYVYYHCTRRRRDVRCRQPSVTLAALEEQLAAFVASVILPPKLFPWVVARLEAGSAPTHQDLEREKKGVKEAVARTARKADSLITMRLEGLITSEEFEERRNVLQKEDLRLAEQVANFDKTVEAFEFLDIAKNFSSVAIECFHHGNEETKRKIVQAVGSNASLKDKKLNMEAVTPMILWPQNNQFPLVCGLLQDVRMLSIKRDPDFLRTIALMKEVLEIAERKRNRAPQMQ